MWVARGKPDSCPDLSPGSAYLELLHPSPRSKTGRVELSGVEALRDSLLAITLAGEAEMRSGLRAVFERADALSRLGFDRWARQELIVAERMHPRDGAEALGVARSALALGALDIAARITRPRLDRDDRGPGDLEWDLLLHPLVYIPLVEEALGPDVDPLLAGALIEAESAGNSAAVSPAGAVGLMQLLPSTAAALARESGGESDDRFPPDLTHAATNIRLGCAHLAGLLRRYEGAEERALAAYNAGAAAVDRWEARTPGRDAAHFTDGAEYAETRAYIKRVLAARAAMARVVRACAAGDAGETRGEE